MDEMEKYKTPFAATESFDDKINKARKKEKPKVEIVKFKEGELEESSKDFKDKWGSKWLEFKDKNKKVWEK